tara:strand:- start:613 stop:813 length:201 start_codon:yes stop_codon:yes gene_type:complete
VLVVVVLVETQIRQEVVNLVDLVVVVLMDILLAQEQIILDQLNKVFLVDKALKPNHLEVVVAAVDS